jgi:hypothetical protein
MKDHTMNRQDLEARLWPNAPTVAQMQAMTDADLERVLLRVILMDSGTRVFCAAIGTAHARFREADLAFHEKRRGLPALNRQPIDVIRAALR